MYNLPMPSQLVRTLILSLAIDGALVPAGEIVIPDCTTSFVDKITFSTDRTGVIGTILEEGARVAADQIVVRLKDEVPQAVLVVAEAKAATDVDIQAAAKEAEAAHLEHEAAVDANRKSKPGNPAFPQTQVQRLLLTAEAADLKVEQARVERQINALNRDQAKAELDTYHIVSGIPGLVTKAYRHTGEGVQQGEALLQVVNTDRLRVEGYVKSDEVYRLRPGQPVQVEFELPESAGELKNRKFTGKLGFVDVSIQPISELVRVWAEIPNRDGSLREGLRARLSIDPDAPVMDLVPAVLDAPPEKATPTTEAAPTGSP